MCRLGEAGESAVHTHTFARTQYIDLPFHVMFLLRSQVLAELRLAACFFRSLAADIIVCFQADQEEIMSQCGMSQQMCRLGVAGESAVHSHTFARTQYIDLPLHVMFFLKSQVLADFRLAACFPI